LAIELIAARTRFLSLESLLAHMNNQFILSADGMRAVSPRQKTLQTAIGWSYDLLSEEEQTLFAGLSVFSGGFTLEEAEAIFSQTITSKPISDLLVSLLDKSLLQRTLNRGDQAEPRFMMLATVQQYALERLRSLTGESQTRDAHLAFFLGFAEQADRAIHGPDQVKWMDRLEMEHDNFRAALDWCGSVKDTQSALRLVGALGWTWIVLYHHSELHTWFDQVRTLPNLAAYPELYARVLNHMGRENWLLGNYKTAETVLSNAREIWLRLGTPGERGLADSLHLTALVTRSADADDNRAQSLFEQGLELYRKHGDLRGTASAVFNLGSIADARGDDAMALCLLEQSLGLYQQLGDLWGIGRVSQNLGLFFLYRGNHEGAHVFFEQHLKIDQDLHFHEGIAIALINLGELERLQHNDEQARQLYQRSLDLCLERGLDAEWSLCFYGLGMVALHQNDYALARQYFIDQYTAGRKLSEKISACDFLIASAAIAAGTNQSQRAAKLYGAGRTTFESMDVRISPFDQTEFDRHLDISREKLGNEMFEVLAAEGRAIKTDQAVAFALENIPIAYHE
jgi:tetratricopeptide (TPR) repeat protein